MKRQTIAGVFMSLLLASPLSQAASYSLDAVLGTTFGPGGFSNPTVVTPYVGTATFTYEAAAPLPNGHHAWNSLTSPTVTIRIGGESFTMADMILPTTDLQIEVRDGFFFFSVTAFNGDGATAFEKINANNQTLQFSTEPVTPGNPNRTAALYNYRVDSAVQASGAFGVVPEPSVTFLTAAAGAFLFLRKRRR